MFSNLKVLKHRSRLLPDLCYFLPVILVLSGIPDFTFAQTPQFAKWELNFESSITYENPLYDLKEFYAVFTSPTGLEQKVRGFWDGSDQFRIRFAPDELGEWTWVTFCSDEDNQGLHDQRGSFLCEPNDNYLTIYQRGGIVRSKGDYFLRHADGTPFFYVACTAWNGALKTTEEEWEKYLSHRVENNYNVIQFVTTQWRGCEKDSHGEVAFTGSGRIELNPAFFQRMDHKIDRINAHGLVAAPVLLWALPRGDGRHLSPGYYLPEEEAILLAKYMVARFGGNQVIWILGGDGGYVKENEQRWKNIGRGVFGEPHPGVVAQHPHGSSWIGEDYEDEAWLDIIGYQSSHNKSEWVINWINKGPMATTWDKLPPKPIMNLEPNYEEIFFKFTDEDVRNASYWSIFATPPSGITYGANGIWPWIQEEGELIENHGNPGDKGPSTWEQSIDFPGSLQIGYLSALIQQFDWWKMKPRPDLLVEQPGDDTYNSFVSVVSDDHMHEILIYTPVQQEIKLRSIAKDDYTTQWFDPVNNVFQEATLHVSDNTVTATPPNEGDFLLILQKT